MINRYYFGIICDFYGFIMIGVIVCYLFVCRVDGGVVCKIGNGFNNVFDGFKIGFNILEIVVCNC